MSVEIKINDRVASVEVVSQKGNLLEIKVDNKIYNIDLMHTVDGTFSIIENGHSYNIELVPGDHPKIYTAYTLYNAYDIEVIDAESRYLLNRGNGSMGSSDNTISSPMPGKVVKLLVSEGDPVKQGETVLIVSAMKMESEYKAPIDGIIKSVMVSEGEVIDANQILIEIE